MKTNILLICALLVSLTTLGQDPAAKGSSSGKITYLEKAKIEIKLEGDAAQFADQLPKEHTSSKVLFFNSDYSLYQSDVDKKEEEEEMPQQGGVMKIKMMNGGENDKIFCDFKSGIKTEQKEFMTRMFLVEGDLSKTQWKLTGSFQTIMGYNCQEAVSDDTVKKVKVWFTTAIPVSSGPAGFAGLPGMILQVDMNNGKRTITASVMDLSFNDPAIFIKPKEGKKVTSEEYKKIVDDKMKEMGTENGEGTNHIIIRIKN